MAASVLLEKVLITDIEYLTPGGTWSTCRARDKDASPESEVTTPIVWDDGNGHAIPLVTYTTPQSPNNTEVGDINFDNFTLDGEVSNTSYTLFHTKGSGLGTYETANTKMIRYKTVCVINDGGSSFPTMSSDYYYAMVRASFDEDNTLIEGYPPTSDSSTFMATLNFKFPGFTSANIGNDAYQALQGILNVKANWRLTLKKPSQTIGTTLNPTTLSLGAPVGSVGDFGVAYIPVTLGVNFTGQSSGEYTLSAQFKKNDTGDSNSWLSIPEPFTVTVQLTLGTATPDQSVIVTGDGEVQITVTIETDET